MVGEIVAVQAVASNATRKFAEAAKTGRTVDVPTN